MTKIYGVNILISDSVYYSLDDPSQFHTRMIDQVRAKGKEQPLTIYEVYSGDRPEIIEKKQAINQFFFEGVLNYYHKKFEDAFQLFHEGLTIYPEDKATRIYADRCQKLLATGWDEDWDGITDLSTK